MRQIHNLEKNFLVEEFMKKLKNCIEEKKAVQIKGLTEDSLLMALEYLKDKNIQLRPTNASTGEILTNAGIGFLIGSGVVVLLGALRIIPGPIGWLALGAGLVMSGASAFVTKYEITISKAKNGKFALSLVPA